MADGLRKAVGRCNSGGGWDVYEVVTSACAVSVGCGDGDPGGSSKAGCGDCGNGDGDEVVGGATGGCSSLVSRRQTLGRRKLWDSDSAGRHILPIPELQRQ